mgnify:FL=1
MTLQKLLEKLGSNTDYYTECSVFGSNITLIVKEYWYHREEKKVTFNIKEKIKEEVIEELKPYIKK